MKVLMINSVCGIRSTGRICTDIAELLEKQGHECKIAYGRESVPKKHQKYAVKIGNVCSVKLDALKTRLFDNAGFNSKLATKTFIKWVKKYDPDVIHLHNVHGYYLNIELLFKYLKSCGKKIIWTLHDCWAFTGHCTHFDFIDCKKWKNGCCCCPQKTTYPRSVAKDNSNRNYFKKRELFTHIPNMTIITPSDWLAGLVKQSFFKEYPVQVIRNGVDISVFQSTKSALRERYDIGDKILILGVASVWDIRKGLEDFLEFSKMVDNRYKIVLIGVSKRQIKKLPPQIIGIERTNDVKELSQWYSAADIFLNLTYEDTYPTVNLESQACGTPVITYRTGGSIESVPNDNIVAKGKTEEVLSKLIYCSYDKNMPGNIIFDKNICYRQYVELYEA